MKKASAKASAGKPNPKPKKAGSTAIPAATLEFLPGWAQNLEGDLRQGGTLTVHYDPDRLMGCRGVHNGLPSWELHGFVKFQPGGQLTSGNLVQHVDDATGRVIVPPRPVPLSLDVPTDAASVELWFKNSDVWGCEAWDSKMGENYRFDVQPAATKNAKPAPRKSTKTKK